MLNYIKQFSKTRKNGFIQNYADALFFNLNNIKSKKFHNNILYITGIPGSGKSELANDIGEDLSIPIISLDEIDGGNYDSIPRQILLDYSYFLYHQEPPMEGTDSHTFLRFLQSYNNTIPCIVEGRQIMEINRKLKNNNSMIVLLTPTETVVHNRIIRDGITESQALYSTTKWQKILDKYIA